jgi:hypothetical protein
MRFLGLMLLCLMQLAKPAPVPGLPEAAGVYFRQDNTEWIKIETAVMAAMKSKGMGEFLETDGYTNLDMLVTYEGAQAKLQIPMPRPTLYVRGAGSAKDAMIVSLTRKKDSRTVRTASSVATVENRAGFRKDEIQRVTVTVYSDNSFAVTPEQDLKPGEFALVFGFANAAYDFGITRPKK